MSKIDRKKFFIYGTAGFAGLAALFKSPMKLFGEKIQDKISDSKKVKFKESVSSVKRKS